MKKHFLIFASTLLLGYTAHAQVTIVPKIGATSATMKFEEEPDKLKAKKGIVLGAGFDFKVSELFSVQPELLYQQQGYQLKKDKDNYIRYSYNYLQVPVLLKVNFGTEQIKAYVNAGPSFGYALGGKESVSGKVSVFGVEWSGKSEKTVKFGDTPNTDDTHYYDPALYSRTDVALQFGGGVGLPIGPGSLLLDVRYGLGLSNFRKENEVTAFGVTLARQEAEGKSRVFAFSLGYAIPLEGK